MLYSIHHNYDTKRTLKSSVWCVKLKILPYIPDIVITVTVIRLHYKIKLCKPLMVYLF